MQRLTPSEYVTKMLRKHENNWKKLIVFPKMGGSFIFTDGRIHYGEYGLYLIKMLNSRLIPELFLYGGKSSGDADSTTSVPPEIHAGLNSRIKRFCRGLLRKYTAKDGTHRGADAVMDYKDVIGAPHFVPVDEKLMNWGDLTEKKLQDKNGKYDAPLLLNNFEFCMINDIDLNEIQNVETFSDVFGELQEVARSRTSIYLELEDDMCNRLNTLVNTRGRINWNGYYKTELYDGPTIYDGLTNLASVTINGKTITLN